jgi:predicted Zn-dependent protease
MLRTQNKIPDAITELANYLKIFMNDLEAWQELCDLYLKVQDYAKAAHAMEELIISHPHHHLYQQRYAEIVYTIGGSDNVGKRLVLDKCLNLLRQKNKDIFSLL